MIQFLFIFVLLFFYFYSTRNHNYWAKLNVKHFPPMPLFGNHFRVISGTRSITEVAVELYKKYSKERVVGYYRGTVPELIVRDPDLVRRIMNVDFTHFYRRGAGRNPEVEPMTANVFHVDGDKWKLLRQRLTPAFTTAKLRAMFPLLVDCAEKLQNLCEKIVHRGGVTEVRELMARFTTEFIGACGFGIQMDSINNEHSLFRALGKKIFHRSLRVMIAFGLWELIPELKNRIRIGDIRVEHGITEILQNIRKQRNYKPIGRNDFIDLLLELETKGTIKGDSIEHFSANGVPDQVQMEMDVKCMAAQVFVFFAAGFETSSNTTSHTLYQLAHHPEIQRKIQGEIDQVLLKYDNKLSYESVSELTLLSMAFKEAMRMFPALGVLNRVCARKYTIPELGITLEPGVRVLIPVQAIQMDEQYYENPKEFRPERFTPEAIADRHKYCYLPFGAGPRACIGARLGEMQSLAGLAAILQHFNVEPAPGYSKDLELDHTHNVVQAVKSIQLQFKPRCNKVV